MLEDTFAAEATHGVFAHGIRNVAFERPTARNGSQSVNIPRGKCGNAAIAKPITDGAWQKRIHRPGKRFLSCRAKFHSCHVDDVCRIGQFGERCHIEQIATDGFNAPGLQTLRKTRSRKTRDGDYATRSSRHVRSTLGHARESWPHLAASAENENVSRKRGKRAYSGLIGFAEEKFEFVNISN